MTLKVEEAHQQFTFPTTPSFQSSAEASSTMDLTSTEQHDSGYESPNTGSQSRRSSSSTPHAIDDLGRDARKLVDTINKLGEVGIEASGLPLPKLVVVGDQSSGKSSLIEAISEIKVPRESGKCTACVLKINLKHAQTATWTMTLVQKYYYDPQYREPAPGDFVSWKRMKKPEPLAQVSLQYPDVEQYLKRAQEALISPRMDQVAILHGNQRGDKAAKFSPNMIQLDVTGPTIPDLTMYDLPGIINQDADDSTLPALVQGLAKSYIDNRNTIVVLACPMNQDFENSTAASKVFTDWKAHARTVGVLTKPDTLPSGDQLGQWQTILEGKQFAVGKGYFVTRQPNSAELKNGISHAQARENENAFFNTEPWSTFFSQHRSKLGTGSLQSKLSSLLAAEIATCLPKIRQDLQARLNSFLLESQQYPEPPPSPYGTVLRIVEKLRSDIQQILVGDMPGTNGLVREWRTVIEELYTDLKKMQPLVIVNTGAEVQWNKDGQVINIDDSDDEQARVPSATPAPGNKRAGSTMSSQESPTKKAKTCATPSLGKQQHAAKFSLDQIKQRICETTTSGVPSDTDPRAEDSMINEAVAHWGGPLRSYLSAVHGAIQENLTKIMDTHTAQWQSTELPGAIQIAVNTCFDEIFDAHEQNCMRTLQAEQRKPFTCNAEMLKIYRQRQLAFLRDERKRSRKRAYVNWDERMTGKPVTEGPARDKKAQTLKDEKIGEDPRDAEIQVMARIRGYYNLAAGTLADNIGKKSQLEVFERLRERLATALSRGLGIDGDDAESVANCKKLLTEDRRREQRRQEVSEEIAKLKKAMDLLNSVTRQQ